MTYLALTHGANGIFYWQLFEAQEDPAVWTAMKNLSREVKALSPVLTAPELPTPSKVSDPRSTLSPVGWGIDCTFSRSTPVLARRRESSSLIQTPAAPRRKYCSRNGVPLLPAAFGATIFKGTSATAIRFRLSNNESKPTSASATFLQFDWSRFATTGKIEADASSIFGQGSFACVARDGRPTAFGW